MPLSGQSHLAWQRTLSVTAVPPAFGLPGALQSPCGLSTGPSPMVRLGASPEGQLGRVVCPGLGWEGFRQAGPRARGREGTQDGDSRGLCCTKAKAQGRVCRALSAGRERAARGGEGPVWEVWGGSVGQGVTWKWG